jgi:hypothetical protein
MNRPTLSERSAAFEDLIADFIVENRREPDFDEMRWIASRIRRWRAYLAD